METIETLNNLTMDNFGEHLDQYQRHLAVEYTQCASTNVSTYVTLCVIWTPMDTFLSHQWSQGLFLAMAFGVDLTWWGTIYGILYMVWTFKEMFMTTAADFVKYNEQGYSRD